ncbi:unnamed protein product, partial [Staurois parvus]
SLGLSILGGRPSAATASAPLSISCSAVPPFSTAEVVSTPLLETEVPFNKANRFSAHLSQSTFSALQSEVLCSTPSTAGGDTGQSGSADISHLSLLFKQNCGTKFLTSTGCNTTPSPPYSDGTSFNSGTLPYIFTDSLS